MRSWMKKALGQKKKRKEKKERKEIQGFGNMWLTKKLDTPTALQLCIKIKMPRTVNSVAG